MFNFNSHINH